MIRYLFRIDRQNASWPRKMSDRIWALADTAEEAMSAVFGEPRRVGWNCQSVRCDRSARGTILYNCVGAGLDPRGSLVIASDPDEALRMVRAAQMRRQDSNWAEHPFEVAGGPDTPPLYGAACFLPVLTSRDIKAYERGSQLLRDAPRPYTLNPKGPTPLVPGELEI